MRNSCEREGAMLFGCERLGFRPLDAADPFFDFGRELKDKVRTS